MCVGIPTLVLQIIVNKVRFVNIKIDSLAAREALQSFITCLVERSVPHYEHIGEEGHFYSL